jgi:hypothetical protein
MDTLHSIIKQIIAAKGSPQFRADADTKENCLSKPAINNEEQHKRNVIFPIIVGFLLCNAMDLYKIGYYLFVIRCLLRGLPLV